MIEWIVLAWFTACPWAPTSMKPEAHCPDGQMAHVFVSSSTGGFATKWNSLSEDQKKTARVFKGFEKSVEITLSPPPPITNLNPSENTVMCGAVSPKDSNKFCVISRGHSGPHYPHVHVERSQIGCIYSWD